MKEEALKLADSYEIRANFIVSHHEKSGRTRMSTTNQSMVKRYKNTADMIRKLVAELDKQREPLFEESNEQVVNAFYKQFPEMKPKKESGE